MFCSQYTASVYSLLASPALVSSPYTMDELKIERSFTVVSKSLHFLKKVFLQPNAHNYNVTDSLCAPCQHNTTTIRILRIWVVEFQKQMSNKANSSNVYLLAKDYLRETYTSQNINPISPTPKLTLDIIQFIVKSQ